jgi:ABC-type glycerol-3-phosphate transport system permease component
VSAVLRDNPDEPLLRRVKWGNLFLHLGLIAGSIIMLLPFWWMLVSSLKLESEVFTFPPNLLPYQDVFIPVTGYEEPLQLFTVTMPDGTQRELAQVRRRGREAEMVDPANPTEIIMVSIDGREPARQFKLEWRNYIDAWNALPFDRYYLNSAVVATATTVIELLISSLAAFAFARLRFAGRNLLFTLYLATLMIPFPVLLIPNFIMVTKYLGWYDTYAALILPPAFSAFSTFLLRQHYLNLPLELDDAARIDGAGSFRIWWNIILPMSGATLAALAIFVFLGSWNSFLWPLVVTNSAEMRTVPIGLNSFQGEHGTRWSLLMAGAVLAMTPVLIVYILAQKWFIKGISLTGIGGR